MSNKSQLQNNEVILQFKDVSVYYGLIQALHSATFDVAKGQIVTLVGANGAGKSTCLRAISGLVKPKSGSIHYRGENLGSLQAHEIVRRRVCQAPEGRGIFLNLSVEENLDLGAWAAPDKTSYSADMERGFHMFPRLKERRKQNAGTLSGGEQQMLAIARALMSRPKLCIFDEPSLGLAPKIVHEVGQTLARIKARGTTILLVEQNAKMALGLADHAYLFEAGEIVLEGSGAELLSHPEVSKAYLGH